MNQDPVPNQGPLGKDLVTSLALSRFNVRRRQFFLGTLRGAGALAAAMAVHRVAHGASAGKDANPFAYDVSRLTQTDPKLIGFEPVTRFRCPNPQPRRIALAPEDRVLVAAKTGVDILDREGQALGQIPLPLPARCVAAAEDGTIFVGLRDHIEVFNAKGDRQATWESPGKKTWLTGLAVTGSAVLAADSGNRFILRYDRSGKLLGRIGEKNKDRNVPGLIVPSPYLTVAAGRDGLLRVNNPGRHCVEVYTLDGDLELSWGKPSNSIQGFCGCCNPIGLALLPDGRCLTTEKGLPRVKLYGTDHSLECVVAGTESFAESAKTGAAYDYSEGLLGGLDAAADATGRVYVLDLAAAEVRVFRRKA